MATNNSQIADQRSKALAKEVVERIMSAHWDMAACKCWVCDYGRCAGFHAKEEYLPHRLNNRNRQPVPLSSEFIPKVSARPAVKVSNTTTEL